jgi:hypothetical protein
VPTGSGMALRYKKMKKKIVKNAQKNMGRRKEKA